MKIMKVKDKKVGDVTYYKYRINLPKEVVEKSGFLDKEIIVRLKKGKIVVENIEKNAAVKLTEREKVLQRELMKLVELRKKEK